MKYMHVVNLLLFLLYSKFQKVKIAYLHTSIKLLYQKMSLTDYICVDGSKGQLECIIIIIVSL